jgi:hypothetical protein
MSIGSGTVAAQFLCWEYICFKFSVLCLCSVANQYTKFVKNAYKSEIYFNTTTYKRPEATKLGKITVP